MQVAIHKQNLANKIRWGKFYCRKFIGEKFTQ